MERLKTYGGEIEKPIANETGETHKVSQGFFRYLSNLAKERGSSPQCHQSDLTGETIGILSNDLGEQGLDNGFNLLETSLPPQTSLSKLEELMALDLQTIQQALEQEGASIINLSIHPLGKRDLKTYATYVAPKGIYRYLWYRGLDHTAGIDARAQNSPTTGVNVWKAADAVSVIIGAGAAFIGLFANSPYEEGKISGFKETRLMMWERMMRNAKVEGDRITTQFPPQRFYTLAQYFNWMFGEKTGIHFVLANNPYEKTDYKGIGDRVLIINNNPSVLEYLSQPQWEAFYLTELMKDFPPKRIVRVTPNISHMEAMQFAQFTGARIRYALNHEEFPLGEFLAACKQPKTQRVEEIFDQWAKYVYIEGRDPGANFPDKYSWDAGEDIARSIVIAPSAIQAGLINNLEKAIEFIDSFPWEKLKELRECAIKHGLQGEIDGLSVYNFTKQLLEIAAQGLTPEEQKFLKYPEWVLATRKNGADRAIDDVENYRGDLNQALRNLVISRKFVLK